MSSALGLLPVDGWFIFFFVIIVVLFCTAVVMFVAYALKINIRERIEKLLRQNQGVIEETENFKQISTNEADPLVVIDVATGYEERVGKISLDANNTLTLYAITETGKPQYYKEGVHKEMLEPEDIVTLIQEVPGLRLRLNTENSIGKLKSTIASMQVRINTLQSEKSAHRQTSKEEMMKEGEVIGAVRKNIYGNASAQAGRSRFNRLGGIYGSDWRGGAMSDDSETTEE